MKSPLKSYREIQRLSGEGKGIKYLAQRFKLKEKDIIRIIQLPPCIACQDYHDCTFGAGKEWYSFADIRYCPFQVIWIIQNRELIEDGTWPESDDHTDPQIHTGYRSEAYFVKPALIWGELRVRLKYTKRDGQTLIEEIDRGLAAIELLSTAARDALMYVKGARRKRQGYAQWLAEKNRTHKSLVLRGY